MVEFCILILESEVLRKHIITKETDVSYGTSVSCYINDHTASSTASTLNPLSCFSTTTGRGDAVNGVGGRLFYIYNI